VEKAPPDASSDDCRRGEGGPDTRALERALRFIEYRPRSAEEIRERLRRWGYDADIANQVILFLEAAGIVDDSEFARLFMNELLRKELGYYRIRSELQKKRLNRDLVEEQMASYPIEKETERACAVAERRLERVSGEDSLAAQKKISKYLVRRGYSSHVARAAIRLAARVDTQTGRELE